MPSLRTAARRLALTVSVGVATLASAAPPAPKPDAPAAKAPATRPGETTVPVTITGGYETDPRDRGRPVVLIAAALKVPDATFRETFTHVRPAGPGQEPDPAQVRLNKQALMRGLAPLGVTDERLNQVSNFYRYPPGRGSLWRHAPAEAVATMRDGAVVGVTVTRGGYGYSSEPTVAIPGLPDVRLKVTLAYGVELEANGSIATIAVVPPAAAKE